MTEFAERLNWALENSGLQAVDLARRVGCGEAAISNYRSGAYLPKAQRMSRIAEALGVSVSWLQGLADDPFAGAHGDAESRLLHTIRLLNKEGQEKVLAYAADLSENPRYTR